MRQEASAHPPMRAGAGRQRAAAARAVASSGPAAPAPLRSRLASSPQLLMALARAALSSGRLLATRGRPLASARVLCAIQAFGLASGGSSLPSASRPLAPARGFSYARRPVCSAAANMAATAENNPLLTVRARHWAARVVQMPRRRRRRLPDPQTSQPPLHPPACPQDSPFPAFSEVKAEHVVPGVRTLLAELNAEVRAGCVHTR